MFLTREEERALDGELGPAVALAMRILVKLGDLYGAERLLPIESAHISGVSYKTAGEAAVDFLRDLRDMGARVAVPSTLNPAGFDERVLPLLNLPEHVIARQEELVRLYEGLGVTRTLTCTPYYIRRPRLGAHLAWAESSAVVYANSVLNACTNREGAPSALAAAIAGKVPDHGLHRPENREPSMLFEVQFKPRDELELWALGFLIGQMARDAVPLLEGLEGLRDWELKGLGAAMASGGMTAMFVLARGFAIRSREGMEKVQVGREDVREVIEKLSSAGEPELIFIGCPHCSREELELIAGLLRGRRVREDVHFWVCTSRHLRESCPSLVKAIEASGALVVADTCVVVSWVERMGVRTVATNSPKAAYYLPGLSGVEVRLASLRECVELACS